MESILDVSRTLCLKFGQNRVSKQQRYCCLRVCVVGGGWWLVLGCKPILVISLNLSQAEQFGFD